MKAPRNKTVHASASYRLYLHLVWPTKYRKHVLGEKLTPVVESKILEVCRTKQYQLFVVKAAVDHMHVLLGMRPTQAVSDVVRDLKATVRRPPSRRSPALARSSKWTSSGQKDIVLSLSARVNSKESGGTSSAKPSIIAQDSDFELPRMRNASTTGRPDLRQRSRLHHDAPTADAVGIKEEFSAVSPLAYASGWRPFWCVGLLA